MGLPHHLHVIAMLGSNALDGVKERFNIRPEHAHHTNAKGAENQETSIEVMTQNVRQRLGLLTLRQTLPFQGSLARPGAIDSARTPQASRSLPWT